MTFKNQQSANQKDDFYLTPEQQELYKVGGDVLRERGGEIVQGEWISISDPRHSSNKRRNQTEWSPKLEELMRRIL